MDSTIAIIGAGFSGLSLAHALRQCEADVVLIDRNDNCPDIFRAEKIEPDQSDLLRELGILGFRQPKTSPIGETLNYNGENYKKFDTVEQYGISYSQTVNNLRSNLPDSIRVVNQTVVNIDNSSNEQKIFFSDKTSLNANLVVVCTGGGEKLISRLGIKRKLNSNLRSLSFGFDIERQDGADFNFNGFNYFLSSNINDVHYITIFPIGERMRVNLFTRLYPTDVLVKQIKLNTIHSLKSIFPGIFEQIGDIKVVSKVQVMPTAFYRLKNPVRSGIVIISDDYQSVNPATGTGLSKVLTDVKVLSQKYIPHWLDAGDFSKKNIREFYRDEIKQACDQKSMGSWFYYDNQVQTTKISIFTRIKQKMMSLGCL